MKGRRRYQAAVPVAGEVVARRRIPTRPQTIRSDFVVPALTGLYLGVWIGVVFGMVFYLLTGYFWMPFGIFVATFTIIGFLWRIVGIDRTIWASEDVARSPVFQEPSVLPMPAVRPPVLLNPYTGRERAEHEQHDADAMAFAEFVRGCQFDTSARRWRGELNYAEWRERLIASGWASWRKPNEPRAGWVLNADAERIIEALADSPTPPID